MSHVERVDVAIIGAGLAGLRLASALQAQHPRLTLLLQGPEDSRQQRLSFWHPRHEPLPEQDAVDARWQHWQVVHQQQTISHSSQRYDYVSLDARRLKRRLLDGLAGTACLRRSGLVRHLRSSADYVQLDTDDGPVSAACVFDTRPPRLASATFCQQFVGQTLVAPQDHGIHAPVLMHFDVPALQAPGVYFLYVLPLSPRRVLLEYTGFVVTPLAEDTLRGVLQVSRRALYPALVPAEMESEEAGLIPMGPVLPLATGPRILPVGVAGGAARAATGYAFCGITRQIEGLLHQLTAHPPGPALERPEAYSWRTRRLDAGFLRVLRREPQRMAEIIGRMASGLGGDDFAAFLSDRDGWWPALKTVWHVPKGPFLRAVAGWPCRERTHA